MGSDQSYGHDPTPHSKQLQSHQDYQIYESQSTEEYEKYQVFHDGSQDFEKNYQFRVQHKHSDLVDIIFAGPTHGFMGCTDRGKYEVITERIPQRLGNMKSVDSKHALVILKTALRGFRDLYRKHGIFGIKDSMIGINKRNKAKVWINHNFAVNRPEETPSSYLQLSVKDQEREMVQNIIDLVDLRAEHGQLWREMINLKEVRNPCTFDQALNMVDYFCGANQLNLGDEVKNGSKKQKKVEMVVQPSHNINRNAEEMSFMVNGSVPVQHFPVPLSNNNISFQSQNRPVPINNSPITIPNFLPLRPSNAHFTFTAPKQQPIQLPTAQLQRNNINFMPQQVTNQPQPNLNKIPKIPEKNDTPQLVEDLATKTSDYRIETHMATFANIAPTQVKTQYQPIGNNTNQLIDQEAQNVYLKQPQFEVHINQIASQQSSQQHSPSVLKSNQDLDSHQLNCLEHKIVFHFEKNNEAHDQTELGPFKHQYSVIAKETNLTQLTPNKKDLKPTPQQNSISYKEMRRLLMEQLQS